MARVRISYIADDAGKAIKRIHPKKSGNVLELDGVEAAKHVRIRLDGAEYFGSHDVLLTWATPEALSLPFSPPLEIGLRLSTDIRTNWPTDLYPWLSKVSLRPGVPVVSEGFETWAGSLEANKPSLTTWVSEILKSHFELDSVDALSVRSDAVANTTVIEAWFTPRAWHEVVTQVGETTEVGVLEQKLLPSGGFAYSGRYRAVGQRSATSQPLLFQEHPNQNLLVPGRVHASIESPYGLHPVLQLDVTGAQPEPECRLFAKLELPSSVFVDRYQLENLIQVWGETDLEAASWSVDKGSVALVWLSGQTTNYEIPLHFRYQLPTTELTFNDIIIAPNVFWACPSRDGREYSPSKLNLESAFPRDTEFWVVQSNEIPFRIPTLSSEHAVFAQNITSLVVIFASLLLVLTTLRKASLLNASKTKLNKVE